MFHLNWRIEVEELSIQWRYNIHDENNVHGSPHKDLKSLQWEVWQWSPHLHSSSNFGSTEMALKGCTVAFVPPDVGNCIVKIKLVVGNKFLSGWNQFTVRLNAIVRTHFHFLFLWKMGEREFYSFAFRLLEYISLLNIFRKPQKKVWKHHEKMIKANIIYFKNKWKRHYFGNVMIFPPAPLCKYCPTRDCYCSIMLNVCLFLFEFWGKGSGQIRPKIHFTGFIFIYSCLHSCLMMMKMMLMMMVKE